MASNPSLGLTLTPVQGEGRTLEQWLTTFHLVSVVVDPYTNESAWILDTAARIMRNFADAAVRVNWVVAGTDEDASELPRPAGRGVPDLRRPRAAYVKALGLERLPAFVFLRVDGVVAVPPRAGTPLEWRQVAEAVAATTAWTAGGHPGAGGSAGLRRDAGLGLTRAGGRRTPPAGQRQRVEQRERSSSSSSRPLLAHDLRDRAPLGHRPLRHRGGSLVADAPG